ncbi:hypothetical protein [Nonomuraea sp. NPDC050310]|uniref:hypothetical protein n=1 Tax=Nonomuraea sp. NPDC050310 TaxID=3154935 RepID=UPI0033E5B636
MLRKVLAALLLVAGCVLAPVAVAGFWAANEIVDSDRYAAAVGPLADDPAVQSAVTERLTDEIVQYLPLDRAVRGAVQRVVTSDAFARAWTEANRVAHDQLDALLSGEGGGSLVTEDGTTVSLDLGPLINGIKQQLVASGLTFAGRIPAAHPTIELVQVEDLAFYQSLYQWAAKLKWVLPGLTVVLLVLGVLAARRRSRALVWTGLGLALGMAVLAGVLAWARSGYLGATGTKGLDPAAAAAFFDALTRSLWIGLLVIGVAGLLLGVGAWLAGRHRRA